MKYLTDKQLNSYQEYYPDECSEFVHVWTKFHTWLPVDIALDDQSYKLREHPLWIYFNNNYQIGEPVWAPLVVSDEAITEWETNF